jgi:Plasmid recombination enzyme
MENSQFLRFQVYQRKKIGRILMEADRHPDFSDHVKNKKQAQWIIGSRLEVETAVTEYMAKPAVVKIRGNIQRQRKRRSDHRCLVAGVASWVDSVDICSARGYPKKDLLLKWRNLSLEWLSQKFGEKLIGVCLHTDESHPHIHFFVVGDAQRLHPGMKNELKDDRRIVKPADRFEAHRAGLRACLDDYYEFVGRACGLHRKHQSNPIERIKNRMTKKLLQEIVKQMADRPDPDILNLIDKIYNSELKAPLPPLKF